MKAASRVQCYDNRDVYFFCLGSLRHPPCACRPPERAPPALGGSVAAGAIPPTLCRPLVPGC